MQAEVPSLRSLFDAARDLGGAAREQFLSDLDSAQRAYVERLLVAADTDTGEDALFVDAASLVGALDEPPPPPMPVSGQKVGPWQLIALIGEGGSSTVFRAAREHAGVRQEAALKLLRRGLYTVEAQRSFRRERQALSQLSHPDIASLIEGGVTESGLAYIVLEFVDGISITEYARAKTLDLRARLRLFLRVCRAVDAAHRALIVHRDLKPSNVLVTREGHVKLLDFGIAKLLDADDDTQTHLPAFTPAYAAPEQRTGALITTATDVYALGVLLGELVTGQRLNDGSGRTPSGRIDELSDPGVLPATPRITRKLLRGDLDNILLKAISQESERRYASAGAMADDIERLLDGRPVIAHPPSRWYRARKFVQRHRGGVAITALFLVAILASLALALWEANAARHEMLRANTARDFVVGLFEPLRLGLAEGKAPTPQEQLKAAIARVEERFADDDAMRADLSLLFSQVTAHMGDEKTAYLLAARAYELSANAYGERDPRTLTALGQRGRTTEHRDDYAAALADLERATAGMQAIGLQSADYGSTLQDLSSVYLRLGRSREATEKSLQGYEIIARTTMPDDPIRATAMNDVGTKYNDAGEIAIGLKWQQQARDWLVDHGLGESRSGLVTLLNVANGKGALGHWHEAMADLEKTIALEQNVSGGSHSLWVNYAQACGVASSLWDIEKSERYCEEAVEQARKSGEQSRSFAIALLFHARFRIVQGSYATARGELARSAQILKAAQGDQSSYLQRIDAALADMARIDGTVGEAIAALAAATSPATIDKSPAAPALLAQFAQLCAIQPLPVCRDDSRMRAQTLLASERFRNHPILVPATAALALLALQPGDSQNSVAMLHTALVQTNAELGPDHPWVAEAQAALASAAALAGDANGARRAQEEADRIANLLPVDHPLRAKLVARK